jgi:UDP-N-acetylglucosamine 4,6-dehydratase
VPALEYNPLEAVKTNIWGTQNVIDAALDSGVEKVLLVSTDKAANPINLYGATKLCAEKLLVAANAYRRASQSPPYFSVVRYGNVVGSRGSIVDTLNEQKKNGEVTLTDLNMTRFWITLDKAVDLVFYSLSAMRGGEIFVPKLPAMKVVDLIKSLAPECRVKTIGIRPGEKIHEDILTSDEARRTKDAGEYYIVEPSHEWWNSEHLKELPSLPSDFNYSSNAVQPLKQEDFLNFV